jgi:rubrerythrin
MGSITPSRTAPLFECGVCCRPYTVAGYLAAHESGAVVCPYCGAHYRTFNSFESIAATPGAERHVYSRRAR